MSTHVTDRVRRKRARQAPPVIDGPFVDGSATVLVVDPDASRRHRTHRALGDVPARIVLAATRADAFVEAAREKVAVLLVNGSDDPDGAVDLVRRLRQADPFFVPILVGLESSPGALASAVNDASAFRVLPAGATRFELRSATLAGLEAERSRRLFARLDRTWVRSLLARIQKALPAPALAELDEKGGELPFDLVLRRPVALRREAGRTL